MVKDTEILRTAMDKVKHEVEEELKKIEIDPIDTHIKVIHTGEVGPRGPKGESGKHGIRGETGVIGPPGHEGNQGIQGDRGYTGEQGLEGKKGDRGFIGIQGLQGESGKDGKLGKIGSKGGKGERGDVGDIPKHKWSGTRLKFQIPGKRFGRDIWGKEVDLQGPAGEGGGTSIISFQPFSVKESGTQVGGDDINTIDFGAGFDVTESPDKEINVSLDFTELSTAEHDHVEASDGGILTGDEHDTYSAYTETSNPANPNQNTARLYMRANGSNIEFVMRSSTGDEIVLASLLDTAIVHTNSLALNWIE